MEKIPFSESKLMILSRHLNEKEFKTIGLWVKSPCHNGSKNVVKLYEIIKKYRKTCKPIDNLIIVKAMGMLPRSAKQKDITPKHKADLRVTMHSLATLIEDFIIWNKTKEDEVGCKRLLMDALIERQTYAPIAPTMKKARKIHEASPFRDNKYWEDAYSLNEMDFYMEVLLKNRNAANKIKDVLDSLHQSCLSKLLYYYCVVVNSRIVVKVNEDYPFMKAVKQYVKNNSDINCSAVRVYYMLLEVLEHKREEDYYNLKSYLFDHLITFDANKIRQLLNFMSNYCNRMVRNGDNKFIQEKFDIYELGINYKCWTAGVYFSQHQFVHTVQTALALNKTQWVKDFLLKYQDTLSPVSKDYISNYCHALYAFHNKDYELVRTHLNRNFTVPPEDFTYHLGLKILCIKTYYDENNLTFNNMNMRSIENDIEAIRQYTTVNNNKKMSETVRQQYSNFANFFKRILNRKKKYLFGNTVTQTSIATLQNDLAELKPLIERTWLEEKVVELMTTLK